MRKGRKKSRSWGMSGDKSWQEANQVMMKASNDLWIICRKTEDSYECLEEVSKIMGPSAVRIVKVFRRLKD